METKKPFDEYWEQILENFEWEKVYQTMKALDWTWYMKDGKDGIPSIDTIQQQAQRHLVSTYKTGYSCSSGGLYSRWRDDALELLFIVESWDAD